MSAIIISMNFLYCADGETRTLTLLLAPDPLPGIWLDYVFSMSFDLGGRYIVSTHLKESSMWEVFSTQSRTIDP